MTDIVGISFQESCLLTPLKKGLIDVFGLRSVVCSFGFGNSLLVLSFSLLILLLLLYTIFRVFRHFLKIIVVVVLILILIGLLGLRWDVEKGLSLFSLSENLNLPSGLPGRMISQARAKECLLNYIKQNSQIHRKLQFVDLTTLSFSDEVNTCQSGEGYCWYSQIGTKEMEGKAYAVPLEIEATSCKIFPDTSLDKF